MASQRIIWLALPNGLRRDGDTTRARISVYVSPQLQPDDNDHRLEGFDFLEWPALLSSGAVTFEVQFGDVTRTATIVSQPDPRLWTALFGRETFVRPYTQDGDSGVVQSYAAGRLH